MKIPAWDERQLQSSSSTASTYQQKTSPCCEARLPTASTATADADHHHHHHDHHPHTTRRSQAAVVRFSEADNVVHDVLPLCEYTAEEVRSCWFSRGEYNSFKRNSLVTLSLNRTGELSPDDPEHTMRGLECRTRECTDSRRILRYRAAAAVFDEQARQRQQLGGMVTDPEALSESYHSISWHALYDAHTQGLADAQDCSEDLAAAVAAAGGTGAGGVEEQDVVFALPSLPSKRNTVLSKIIAIDRAIDVVDVEEQEDEEQVSESTTLIAGFDCELWASNASAFGGTPFNLNRFFNDALSNTMGTTIAVAAA